MNRCPRCAGRMLHDGHEHVCIACGFVLARVHVDPEYAAMLEAEANETTPSGRRTAGRKDGRPAERMREINRRYESKRKRREATK